MPGGDHHDANGGRIRVRLRGAVRDERRAALCVQLARSLCGRHVSRARPVSCFRERRSRDRESESCHRSERTDRRTGADGHPATAGTLTDRPYELVIGIETHVELATESKMFCGCAAKWFGAPPNSLVCPVCLGLPGALPVPNKRAIELAMVAGLALNCQVPAHTKFDRRTTCIRTCRRATRSRSTTCR